VWQHLLTDPFATLVTCYRRFLCHIRLDMLTVVCLQISSEPQMLRRFLYLTKLIHWSYYEGESSLSIFAQECVVALCTGLLDTDLLWSTLLAPLSENCPPEESILLLYLLYHFLEDMCRSLPVMVRLSDYCVAKCWKVRGDLLSLFRHSFRASFCLLTLVRQLTATDIESVDSPLRRLLSILTPTLQCTHSCLLQRWSSAHAHRPLFADVCSVAPAFLAHSIYDRLFSKALVSSQPPGRP
jgi:hypothetical protein